MRILRITLMLAILGVSTLGFGQILEPVKWSFSKKSLGDNIYELVFKASIEACWHLYSQDVAMQPPATLFTFEENDLIELVGKVTEGKNVHKVFDENFQMDVKYFEGEAKFVQKVKVLTKKKVTLEGYLEYMCCDDKQCMPPTEEYFEFVFNNNEED